MKEATLEPVATEQEIEFILETAGRYLEKPPTRNDILSIFAGIRPLVKSGEGKNTAALSRDHTIHIDNSGLITVTGGKWTTYRNMAEDAVSHAITLAELEEKPCITRTLQIHGYHQHAEKFGALRYYGGDAPAILDLARQFPTLAKPLHPKLPYTGVEVLWATRYEMARTVEDVLARRTRSLFLNAKAAREMSPAVAKIMADELGKDTTWQTEQVKRFEEMAGNYLVKAMNS